MVPMTGEDVDMHIDKRTCAHVSVMYEHSLIAYMSEACDMMLSVEDVTGIDVVSATALHSENGDGSSVFTTRAI